MANRFQDRDLSGHHRKIRDTTAAALRLFISPILCILLLMPTLTAQTPPIESGVSLELAKWRAERYSDVRYKLNLTLEKMSPVLKGTMEIRVKVGARTLQSASPQNGEIPPIILDWRKIAGHEEKSTISNVTINGRSADTLVRMSVASTRKSVGDSGSLIGEDSLAGGTGDADRSVRVPFEDINEHLVFRDGVVTGENVIKLDFTSPILTSGSAITRYIDKEDGSEYIYSLFVPSDASTAFPVFDQPDLKARFYTRVYVPVDWTVISNGKPQAYMGVNDAANRPTGKVTYWFLETKPISTYVFSFAAGNFAEFAQRKTGETVNLSQIRLQIAKEKEITSDVEYWAKIGEIVTDSIYVRRSQAAKFKPHAAEVFRLNREAIKYFEEYFDYKFPFPKYDLVLIPEFPFGGMEHAGATFLRESAIIFPQEPTKNDHISRALLIFHEASHQWFGDTVTMRWFDDLWLKEGFATFTAYKAMERIMPEMNAWKVFYERVKQAAYQTDSTKGTTPIYQEIPNLSAAKSAYGNIVYNKAPAFLRQAEFYLGEDKFQTAVRAFLKKHEFGNAGWEDLVKEFEVASNKDLNEWARVWVKNRGLVKVRTVTGSVLNHPRYKAALLPRYTSDFSDNQNAIMAFRSIVIAADASREIVSQELALKQGSPLSTEGAAKEPVAVIPNYQDYGYGIFLLDPKSRDYVLNNIQNEKDPFLRSMMWGALWDSVREGELDPRVFVELVIKQLGGDVAKARASARAIANQPLNETDETIVALLVSRVSTALNYYIDAPDTALANARASATEELRSRFESVLLDRMRNAPTLGERITFYRAFLNVALSEKARGVLKSMLSRPLDTQAGSLRSDLPLKAKDKFDIVTRLLILGDADAPRLLAELEKTETGDDAKRYAYAARAGIPTAENKAKYWNDFVNNKEISESWIEAAFVPWNSIRHSELTLPYLQRALQELPNHKRNRKIFFVNGWLGAFIGGQRSEQALGIIDKFLADNPSLDRDLRLKILENADIIERSVRIRKNH